MTGYQTLDRSLGRRAAVTLVAAGVALTGVAHALDADIDTKLPYNITYSLDPVTVSVNVKGGAQGKVTYHVYDILKNAVAKGEFDGASHSFTFTPPAYGWYVIAVESGGGGVAEFVGVTPEFEGMHTLKPGDMKGDWNDSALIAFAGLGLDRTNTRHRGIDGIAQTLANSEKFGVPLLLQFEGKGHCTPGHVREAVTKYKGRVKYWEIMNEPNFSMSPEQYADMVKQLVPIIKGIDPAAKVMGPDVCGVDLGWYDRVYKAGAGKVLDIISIHDYEGDEAVDEHHWQWKIGELRKIMARHGDAKKELWQTERAIGGVRAGLFLGPTQAIRVSLQRDLLELFGVTNDHNSHYYANVTGYNDVPTFVYSESGPYPAALVCRTRAAMTSALKRRFAEKLDFGPTGNKVFLGLLYEGRDGSTVTLRNLGTADQGLELGVSGGKTLEVVDSFGNVDEVPVRRGKALVTVRQFPCFVKLARGQRVTPPKIDFGRNFASEARFVYSAGGGDGKILTDGKYQVWHSQNPWGDVWKGGYAGSVFDEKPETFDIIFDTAREIGGLLVFGARADNPHCALLDYDIEYNDGGRWVTLEKVRAHCPQSDPVKTFICKTVTWYLDSNFFVHRFKRPVETDKLRLTVRRITRGCFVDMVTEKAIGWRASAMTLELREIEVYGPLPETGLVDAGRAGASARRARPGRGPKREAAADAPAEEGAASPEVMAKWDLRLARRIAREVKAGGKPRFHLASAGASAVVLSVGRRNALEVSTGAVRLTLGWSRLSLKEKKSLALAVARRNASTDHALAAFYLLATGEREKGGERLKKAGKFAEEVRSAFK